MAQRGITDEMVAQVLEYGRQVFSRGAIISVVGRKEVYRLHARGIDISHLEGLHVVCPTDKFGMVTTVYRNRNQIGVKPNMGRGRHNPWQIHSRKPLPRTLRDHSAWSPMLDMPA